MRRILTVAGVVAMAAACKGTEQRPAGDTAGGMGVDTTVTERTVQDTTIVRTDTTVQVDTMVKRGGTVGADTVRRP
jgi:hypothetical protein